MKEPLEKFGAFLVENLRDKMLGDLDMLLRGGWKAPEAQELQAKLSRLSEAQKEALRDAADHMISTGMHDLLFAFQEEADTDGSIRLTVDGHEIAKLSDGLHGEVFGADGWISRYSRFSAEREAQRSRDAKADVKRMSDDEKKG